MLVFFHSLPHLLLLRFVLFENTHNKKRNFLKYNFSPQPSLNAWNVEASVTALEQIEELNPKTNQPDTQTPRHATQRNA